MRRSQASATPMAPPARVAVQGGNGVARESGDSARCCFHAGDRPRPAFMPSRSAPAEKTLPSPVRIRTLGGRGQDGGGEGFQHLLGQGVRLFRPGKRDCAAIAHCPDLYHDGTSGFPHLRPGNPLTPQGRDRKVAAAIFNPKGICHDPCP